MDKFNRIIQVIGKIARISLIGHGVIGVVFLSIGAVLLIIGFIKKPLEPSNQVELNIMKKTLEGLKSCEDDSVFYTQVDVDIDSIYIKELLNILNNGNYQLKQQESEDGFDSSYYKFGVGNSYFLIEDTVLKNTLYLTQNMYFKISAIKSPLWSRSSAGRHLSVQSDGL